jgi:hypothetical protein
MTQCQRWRRATASDPDSDRLSDSDLSDEIFRLAKFSFCLAAAIEGAETFRKGKEKEGVYWLARDIASEIGVLADAFDEECTKRMKERARS